MSCEQTSGAIIYFNDAAGFGLLRGVGNDPRIRFFHFTDLPKDSDRVIRPGSDIVFRDLIQGTDARLLRRATAGGMAIRHTGSTSLVPMLENNHSEQELNRGIKRARSDSLSPLIFHGVHFESPNRILGDIDDLQAPILFLDCVFESRCIINGMRFGSNIYFCGSRFHDRFSLKGCHVNGDVHMEACDFTGCGGASFRGLRCQSLYLDFGVVGPRDMVWLNDMHVAKELAIGGRFQSDIQIMRRQEQNEKIQGGAGSIGRITVGYEYDDNQLINRTTVSGVITMDGVRLQRGFRFARRTLLNKLFITDSSCELSMNDVDVASRVDLYRTNFIQSGTQPAIGIRESQINDRLRIVECDVRGDICLDGTSVANSCELRGCTFAGNHVLSLYALRANLFSIDPPAVLNGLGHTPSRRFRLLKREHPLANNERTRLIAEYVSLRNWLGATGHLSLEDKAFFRLRSLGARNPLARLVYGGIFGWGVSLWNVFASSCGLIVVFALVFGTITDLGPTDSLVVSVESFFDVLRGDWGGLYSMEPWTMQNVLSAVEGICGVLFTTVLVGAYMRKLLR